MFSIEGKMALVTGANTRLGQRISVAYASAGANVIGVARRSYQETADQIKAEGGNFTEIIADLSDVNVISHIMEESNVLADEIHRNPYYFSVFLKRTQVSISKIMYVRSAWNTPLHCLYRAIKRLTRLQWRWGLRMHGHLPRRFSGTFMKHQMHIGNELKNRTGGKISMVLPFVF